MPRIPFVEGDKLDILELAQGFIMTATVNIYRYRDNSPEFEVLRYNLRDQHAEDIVYYLTTV